MADSPLESGFAINFAQNGDAASQDRLTRRLVQSRGPSTQQSTGNWIDWESLQDVLGQPFDVTKIPLSKLDQMRRDPMLAFGLATKIVPLIRAKWDIQSSDPQRAAFIKNALSLVYARYILGRCNALSFGFSPGVKRFEYMQPDWKYVDPSDPEHTEKDVWPSKTVPAIVWKSFVWLDPRSTRPHWNYKGEFAGIDYTPTGAPMNQVGFFGTSGSAFNIDSGAQADSSASTPRPADIPLDWAIWATNDKDAAFGSIYGYPLIGHAYRYWWSYWYKFGLSDRAFEKWADPPIIVYHPAENGVDSQGNIVDFGSVALGTAEQMRSGANVALPSQVIIDQLNSTRTNIREWDIKQLESHAEFKSLIDSFNYLDVLKLRSIMVPEMGLIEGAQGQSSRNVAEIFTDQIQKAQAVLMEEIDYEINRFLIPQLLEANFGPGGASCTKVTTGFDPQDVETMRAIVGAIANKHGDIPDVDTREMLAHLGIPLLTYDAVKNKLEAIAKQQDTEAALQFQKLQQEASLRGHKVGAPVATDGSTPPPNQQPPTPPGKTTKLSEDEEERVSVWQKLGALFYADTTRREEMEKERHDALLEKVTELAEREVNLEVVVPEMPTPIIEVTEQPKKFRKLRKFFNRDDEGNIVSVDEVEVELEEGEEVDADE